MPIYEYVCKQCGKVTDVLQKMNDPAPEKCEGCGAAGTLNRVVSRTSFVLKGGGWYSDLYGSAKKDAKKEGGDGAKSEGTTANATSSGSGSGGTGGSSSGSSTGAGASGSSSSSSAGGGSSTASSASSDKK